MMDTRGVRNLKFMAVVASLMVGACPCLPQSDPAWTTAISAASKLAPQARIVVVDISTGKLLGASDLSQAARTLAAPGSTLKPLVLYGLVATNGWDPSRRIACTRKLTVAGRSLNCSHPAADPMDARQALTWSCNTYFATVAATLAQGELRTLLAPTGLLGQSGLATGEAIAAFHDPQNADQNRLTLLGVDGILVTPLELATAYRWLGMQLAAHPNSAAAQTVQSGLAGSASFGIADAASMGGVPVVGKTGTANLGPGTPSHGWFVGLAPSNGPRAVVAVYLPAGHGADAARVAAELLAHSPLRQLKP